MDKTSAQSMQSQEQTRAVLEEEARKKPFGIKDKLGYMFGDFGNDFFFMMASGYLMVFYTDILGIPGTLVGTLFLVSRFFDAFTDIGMGRIVDNAKLGPAGRYRPWIRRFTLPVIFAGLLLFIPWVANLPYGVRVAYIFITYILWGSFCYTGINIPYGSMAAAMTDDPVHRSALSTFRSMGAALAGVFVNALTPLFVYDTDAAGNQILNGNKLFIVALVFAVLALICYTLCYKFCTERIFIENDKSKKQSAGQLVAALLNNRALIAIIVAAIISLLSLLLVNTMNVYLFKDYFRNAAALSVAGLLGTAVTLILAPFSKVITEKIGKKEASAAGLLISSAVFALMFMVRITNPWVFCAFLLFGNLGSGIFQLMVWAFISDIIDYQTVQTGSNDGGTIYGIYSFARKVGQAFAGGLGGYVISAIGYQSAVAGQAVVQTESVTNAIYAVCTGVPAVGYLLIALVLIFWYPLSRKKMIEIREQLDKMNAD